MTDIALSDTQKALKAILEGEYDAEERHILQGSVTRHGQVLLDTLALNDVVVSRGASIETQGSWTNNYLTGQSSAVPSAVLSAAGVATAAGVRTRSKNST